MWNKGEYYRALGVEPYVEVTSTGLVLHKLRHIKNAGLIQLSASLKMEVK